MKYFLDTEFIEGIQEKRVLGFKVKTKPTIDLISIGIVCEDGREYYAISKDFNLKEAWNRWDRKKLTNEQEKLMIIKARRKGFNWESLIHNIKGEHWIRNNILSSICIDLFNIEHKGRGIKYQIESYKFTYKELKRLINKYGKTNKQIAEEIKEFCLEVPRIQKYGNPEFYAYYADYDWVAFCWLFGKMIDLPNRFPKYCIDLKQTLETKKEELKQTITDFKTYPKQTNEHNALADALFCKDLYNFLNTL